MVEWTLDELVRRAGEALAAHDVRVPNGRVTPLPDRRVVRWYSTIGLVDRPVAYRGRTALYGPRHLLQVVAVKRRQADGRSLAEIQTELAGATDRTLREVAQIGGIANLPDAVAPPRPRFWAQPPPPEPASPEPPSPASAARPGESGLVYGVALGPGVTLMLPGAPDDEDLTEIRAAARPLLDLLARRGLRKEGG